MLTKNYYAFLFAYGQFDNNQVINESGESKTMSSCSHGHQWYGINALKDNYISSPGNYGIAFGSGNTAATKNDYHLEQKFTSSTIEVTTPSQLMVSRTDNYLECVATYIIKNISNNNITIKEIGLFGGDSYDFIYNILLERTVLDSPVTIAAGASETITYRFRCNYGN